MYTAHIIWESKKFLLPTFFLSSLCDLMLPFLLLFFGSFLISAYILWCGDPILWRSILLTYGANECLIADLCSVHTAAVDNALLECQGWVRHVELRPVASLTFPKRQLRKICCKSGCLSGGSSIKWLVVIYWLFLPQHCDVSWKTVYSHGTVLFALETFDSTGGVWVDQW